MFFKEVEREKMKAIGSRNLLKSYAKQREAQQEQLRALIGRETTSLIWRKEMALIGKETSSHMWRKEKPNRNNLGP